MFNRLCLGFSFVLFGLVGIGLGEDWPQWMGPNRDNQWKIDKAIEKFPSDGPKKLWSTPIAGGYSGPAVAGDKLFVTDFVTEQNVRVDNFGRKGFSGTERILCINATNGEILWKHEYPVNTTVSYPAGPRCTPVVDGDRVYTVGAEGDLFCLNTQTGKVVWEKNLKKVYSANSALWGYAAHPLIDGDKLITLAGTSGNQTVALNKKTGEQIWAYGTAPEQGYSPPTIITAGKRRLLILPNPAAINAVDPETGKEVWTTPYEASNGSIIMSPIKIDNYLYIGGYSNRNLLLELSPDGSSVKVLWRDKAKVGLSPVNVQPIAVGKVIYGCDQSGELLAFQVPDGKRLWETSKPISKRPQQSGTAFIVKQADKFILFNESGELILADLSPKGYEELDRIKIIEPTNNAFGRDVVWCAPAFANGSVYVRNDESLVAYKLK